jgi:hypothetical protein
MNIFNQHPHEQGVSYFEHLDFAVGVAWRLLTSVVSFTLHALFPFITIKRQYDLEATSAFLLERNSFIESAAAKGQFQAAPGHATRNNTPAAA